MSFSHATRVRFGHVDAAGIVFYPRYFEMINAAVEEWFAAVTGTSFAEFHGVRRLGLPTVQMDCQFVAPSRLGELLDISVTLERCGTASCTLAYRLACLGVERVKASAVLVCLDLDRGRATPWPEDVRVGFARMLAG